MKRIIISAFLMTAGWVGAETVHVAEHGIVPGKDVSAKVNQLIKSLEGKKDVTLVFPKGQYDFYPEHAVEKYRAVTNHDNSQKRLAFPVYGFDGFTIEGNGSTFMFHGRICPITLEGSKKVTLKNFTIDWDTPFHHELNVVESDPGSNTFVAEISPMKYGFEIKDGELLLNHYNWQNIVGQNVAFDSNTKAPSYKTSNYSLSQKKKRGTARKIGENLVEMKNTTKVAPPVGTVICAYGPSPGFNRLAQAIHASNSSDIKIENVTVLAAGGMALIAERCENVELDAFVVTSRDDRTMATRADATHFLGCKGVIKLENCRLEHMADDGINVHGAYVKVEEYKGNATFLCAISHVQQMGLIFCEPGDKVMITSRETVLPIYETTVAEVKILDEEFFEVTVADVPNPMPEGILSMENLTWYPDVVMKNNIIRDNRARSALITTKGNVLIENNYFSSQMHGILIEGDNKSWYESGGVRDITITNNEFVNIGYGSGEHYPLFAAPMFLPEQRLGDDQYHWNVKFTNNKIKSFNGLLCHATSVKGLVLSGNTIELSADYPSDCDKPSIELIYCKDSAIENNTFSGFDRPIEVEQKENCSNVKVKNNKGLK